MDRLVLSSHIFGALLQNSSAVESPEAVGCGHGASGDSAPEPLCAWGVHLGCVLGSATKGLFSPLPASCLLLVHVTGR